MADGPAPHRRRSSRAVGRRRTGRCPAREREAAFAAGLAAYDRGDFFLTHELLEPAWMGTDDLAERELYQGLIKLAAAFVHGVRGNPLGIAKNLEGARAAARGRAARPARRRPRPRPTSRRHRRPARRAWRSRPRRLPDRATQPQEDDADDPAARRDPRGRRQPRRPHRLEPRRRARSRSSSTSARPTNSATSGSRAPPSMPMSTFAERHAELPKDRPLLVMCAGGTRSAAATGFLLRSGWTDVANVDGGITAWQRAACRSAAASRNPAKATSATSDR